MAQAPAATDTPLAQRIAELARAVLGGHRLGRDEALDLAAAAGDEVYDLF